MQREEYFEAYFALMESGELLRDLVEHQLKDDAQLSYVQFRILALLSESEPQKLRMTQLADSIVHSRSGISYQAQQLEKRGYVERTSDEVDERGVTISLTKKGMEALEEVVPEHIRLVFDTLFTHLPDEDVAAMTKVLSKVRGLLREQPSRSKRHR